MSTAAKPAGKLVTLPWNSMTGSNALAGFPSTSGQYECVLFARKGRLSSGQQEAEDPIPKRGGVWQPYPSIQRFTSGGIKKDRRSSESAGVRSKAAVPR
jgi:hypothetical protein